MVFLDLPGRPEAPVATQHLWPSQAEQSGDITPLNRECRRARARVTPFSTCEEDKVGDASPLCWHQGSQRGSLLTRLDRAVVAAKAFGRLEDGQTGGVYWVPSASSGWPMAVFKPDAEEAFQRRGIPSGGGAVREEAAYLLDRLVGSAAGVPVTVCAKVPAPVLKTQALGENRSNIQDTFGRDSTSVAGNAFRMGSVQRFVPDVVGAAEDFAMPQQVEAAARVISVAAAQQIASLDLRLCNTDRHSGNLLFQRCHLDDAHTSAAPMYKPVPIDHGCTLPRWWSIGEANFEAWAAWPQVRAPCLPEVQLTLEMAFACREKTLHALANIGLEPAAQATYHILLALLYECIVRHGLSLMAVAALIARDPYSPGEPSWLELCMVKSFAALGMEWQWTENTYGDKVPAVPENPGAWPPSGLVEHLEELFASEETLAAGKDLEQRLTAGKCWK